MPERRSRSFAERFKPIVQMYSSVMKELLDVDNTCFFPAKHWAALKILCFAQYIHTCYIPIISKNEKMKQIIRDNFYFIDLLSGSGINRISLCEDCILPEDECAKCSKRFSKTFVVGSAVLACSANPPFKELFFVDIERKNIDVLEKRIEIIKERGLGHGKTTPIHGDCNVVIDEILDKIRSSGNYHLLAFVDNKGLNAEWVTIEKLLGPSCDMIINYPTSSINRNLGTPYEKEAVKRFFGCDNIDELGSDPLQYYVSKIKSHNRSAEIIPINTAIGFHYDLILVTKKNPGYSAFIESLKRTISANTAVEARIAFEIISGGQTLLTSF